jgi:hypothetical protein
MERDAVEKKLYRFKIKEPAADLKHKVLLRAKAAWKEGEEPVVVSSGRFRLLRNCAGALAGAVLLVVITLTIYQRPVVKSPAIQSVIAVHTSEGGAPEIPRTAREKPRVKYARPIENDSEMKDLYASVGLDYRSRQLLLSLRQESDPMDSIRARLEQQEQILKELES